MAVELAEAYISLIPSAKGIQSKLAQELGGPEVTGAATSAGDAASEGFMSKFAGSGLKIAGIITAGLAAGAVGVGAGLLKIGSGFEEAFNKIRVQTGATGTSFEALKGNMEAALGKVPVSAGDAATAVGTLAQKLDLTGAPLTDLATQVLRLSHVTGTDLSANLTAVSGVFNSFGVAADDQGLKLDELFRASQATGVSVESLGSTMADSGVVLRQVGLSFEDSAALIGVLGKAGLDAGAVMPALSKSLATAAKDGKDAKSVFNDTFTAIKNAPNDTAAASVAMDVFGAKAGPKLAALVREGKLSYQELSKAIADGGDSIDDAANDTLTLGDRIKLFANRAQIAIQPLATKVLEFATSMYDRLQPVLREVTTWVSGHLVPAVSSLAERIAPVVQHFLSIAVSNIGPVLKDMAGHVSALVGWLAKIDWPGVFGTAMSVIQPVIDAVKDYLVAWFDFLWASVQTLFKLFQDNRTTLEAVAATIKEVLAKGAEAAGKAIGVLATVFHTLAGHMGAVKAVVIPLAAAFAAYKTVTLAFTAAQWLITTATDAWAAAQALLNGAMALNPIALVVGLIAGLVVAAVYAYTHFQTFRDVIDSMWDTIKAAFNWVKDNWPLLLAILTGPIGLAVLEISRHWDGIKNGFTTVKDWISDRIDDIVGFFTGLPGKISSAVSGMWDGIKNAFKGAINWVIDHWNALSFTTPQINFFGYHTPQVTIGVPKIPRLESGAVVTSPMLAMIGETAKARPEIVTPQALMAKTFEDVLARTRPAAAAGAVTVNVTSPSNPWEIANQVAWTLKTGGT